MPSTSPALNAWNSAEVSVMNLKTTLSSFGLGPQYLSFGISVICWVFCQDSIFQGPPVQEDRGLVRPAVAGLLDAERPRDRGDVRRPEAVAAAGADAGPVDAVGFLLEAKDQGAARRHGGRRGGGGGVLVGGLAAAAT